MEGFRGTTRNLRRRIRALKLQSGSQCKNDRHLVADNYRLPPWGCDLDFHVNVTHLLLLLPPHALVFTSYNLESQILIQFFLVFFFLLSLTNDFHSFNPLPSPCIFFLNIYKHFTRLEISYSCVSHLNY